MIPYGKQDLNQQDIDSVIEVLQSDFLTQGPQVPRFERSIRNYTGVAHAVAVNSATSALHIACLSLNVSEMDAVWTSPITFVASANCALYCGAQVDFIDIDKATGNISIPKLKSKLSEAERLGTLPKVVIPVHLCGHSCDMKALKDLSIQYSFKIIEDASHGIGGSYLNSKLGSCQYSDICIFSFHPVKIITTAEGGVATTNDDELAKLMRRYRSHGITRISDELSRPDEGGWYYEQHQLGYNYRMSEIHAALGSSQMNRLDEFVEQRNKLAQTYYTKLEGLPLSIIKPLPGAISANHLLIVQLSDAKKRKAIFNIMREGGVQVHVHYFPVHLQPFYSKLGFCEGDFPHAEAFYKGILTLPLFPQLMMKDLEEVVEKLTVALGRVT